jgi:hypothetical protein
LAVDALPASTLPAIPSAGLFLLHPSNAGGGSSSTAISEDGHTDGPFLLIPIT